MRGRMVRITLLVALMLLAFVAVALAFTGGQWKARVKPSEFGTVIMMKSSTQRAAPVVFKHWLHRSKYTCRLCHVDIGFGMRTGTTPVTCEDNKAGLYCGSCHNGKESFALDGVSEQGVKNCDRCHSYGKTVAFKYEFHEYTKQFRKERFGNGIDWLHAEESGLVHLKDYIEGVSIRREQLKDPKDMTLFTREHGMPNIIFSHKKHAIWSGCELCHPSIFGIKAGVDQYSMQEIFDGKFCGACHGSVAFPNLDCQRCHLEKVQ